jgi:hypothetical protein
MTIDRHACLDGSLQLGDAFDCPKCWSVLIKSLNEDADPATPVPEIQTEISPPPADHHTSPVHRTTADTAPHGDKPGGWWIVNCPCGWKAFGTYARDGGEAVALRLASLKGAQHEEDPDRRCAYCGHPKRLAACTFCANDIKSGRG